MFRLSNLIRFPGLALDDLAGDFASPPRAPLCTRVKLRLSKAFQAMIAARERQARAIVRAHLATHDDAALERFGCSRAEIESIRRQGHRPPSSWL